MPGADGDENKNACQSNLDCPFGEFCNDDVCEGDLPCTQHEDCGLQAYCNASGFCEYGATGTPCITDDQCPAGQECYVDDGQEGICGCDSEVVEAQAVPPNFLLVLDRSGSMDRENRWQEATGAIDQILTNFETRANMGLMMFPNDATCGVGAPQVSIAANNGNNIRASLASLPPQYGSGSTPIAATMSAVYANSYAVASQGENNMIFISDGGESCGGGNPPGDSAMQIHTQQGVNIFSIAFTASANTATLNTIANQGGTGQALQATDQSSMVAALESVFEDALPCRFALSDAAPSASSIFIYADGTEVPSGWSYDDTTNEIVFDQTTCESLRNQGVEKVDVVFGCNFAPN